MDVSYKISSTIQDWIKTLLVSILVMTSIYVLGNAQTKDASSILPQFEITGSQLLKINSAITGQDYVLYVSLPQRYNDTSKTFPVVYVLDGQWDFPLVQAIYGDQYYDGFMPGAIIVAITWGGENPNYDKRRAFDLTPTDNGQPAQFGNANKFLSFIKNEIIPFIDSKYRTNKNNRTLAGHSFGGLFTLYALFTETELFNQYIPGSPAWSWEKASLLKYVEKFSKINLSHPVKVYAFMGEYEDVIGFEKLAAIIRDCKIKDLDLETQIVKGSGHAGTKPEGYNRGLQYVFKRPCLNIGKKILERYAGEYEIDPKTTIKVATENGQLVVYTPDNSRFTLCAESENDFYLIGAFLNAKFTEDQKGNITGFKVQQYSEEMSAKKIK
jgi:predicted alpha/beta superfamily hydrolase